MSLTSILKIKYNQFVDNIQNCDNEIEMAMEGFLKVVRT